MCVYIYIYSRGTSWSTSAGLVRFGAGHIPGCDCLLIWQVGCLLIPTARTFYPSNYAPSLTFVGVGLFPTIQLLKLFHFIILKQLC